MTALGCLDCKKMWNALAFYGVSLHIGRIRGSLLERGPAEKEMMVLLPVVEMTDGCSTIASADGWVPAIVAQRYGGATISGWLGGSGIVGCLRC